MTDIRQSIQPTYDSRETGPRYHVTTKIDGHPLDFMAPIDDPFVRQTVTIGWRDLLRGLLRRRLVVEVSVGGDHDIVEDVFELDDNYLGFSNSTRRQEFNAGLNRAMRRFAHHEAADAEAEVATRVREASHDD